MTPQEWWRAIKDAGFDATTTKVLYALSLEPFDSNGTMCRPPVTYASFARKAGVKKGDVWLSIHKARGAGWLVDKGNYYRSADWLNVLWTLAVGDKNG